MIQDVMGYCLHEVGLAQSHSAVYEERVVDLGRSFGDRQSCRVGESVGGPDDEVLEDVSRVEAPKVLGNILGTPALSLTGRGGLGGK